MEKGVRNNGDIYRFYTPLSLWLMGEGLGERSKF
jgi:hypothetical protein